MCQQVCETYKFLPDDLETLIRSGPVCLVERVGGVSDGVTDRAIVQVSVWADTRPNAWAAAKRIGALMDSYTFGGPVGNVFIDQITRDVGEQQIFTDDPDERRVTASYRLDARKQ